MALETLRASLALCCFSCLVISITFVLQACTKPGELDSGFLTNVPECSADVVLILDKSKSVGSHWGSVRNAAINFVTKLERKNVASNGESQIGVLSFARRNDWGTKLTDSFAWARTQIHDITRLQGCTRLYPALDEVALELISSDRVHNQKVAVLFTDGEPTCDRDAMDKAYNSARSFRNFGRLVVVGMRAEGGGQAWDEDFMKSLATDSDENFHELHSFASLTNEFIDTLVEGVCKRHRPIQNQTTPAPEHNQTTPAPTEAPTFPLD